MTLFNLQNEALVKKGWLEGHHSICAPDKLAMCRGPLVHTVRPAATQRDRLRKQNIHKHHTRTNITRTLHNTRGTLQRTKVYFIDKPFQDRWSCGYIERKSAKTLTLNPQMAQPQVGGEWAPIFIREFPTKIFGPIKDTSNSTYTLHGWPLDGIANCVIRLAIVHREDCCF